MSNDAVKKPSATAFVFIKISLILLAALAGIAYLARDQPSEAEACAEACSAQGKRGKLVFQYSKVQTAGMRGRGPAECYCEP